MSHAIESGATRVRGIHLRIGELSTLQADTIHRDWDRLTKGTLADGAELHVRPVPAELQCMVCFEKYHPERGELVCPFCGSLGAKILAGEEFSLEKIDLAG